MKLPIAVVLLLASVASARHVVPENNIPYGYLRNVGIPAYEKMKELESEYNEAESRIANGPAARLGEVPWQAGLIGQIVGGRQNIAGGSLISRNRVVTAAHNAISPTMTVSSFTIVLGTLNLMSGGTRVQSSRIILHPQYNPSMAIVNDVAMLHLATQVSTSASIAPVALPSGADLSRDFNGMAGVTSGFGMTEHGMPANPALRRLDVRVISNSQCAATFGGSIRPTHICTSSSPGTGICTGDSGGPLVVRINNRPILVGITSFGAMCGGNSPDGFTRVTSFISFIQQHM